MSEPTAARAIQRIRHQRSARVLRVQRLAPLTPNMVRVTLTGAELEDFASMGFDDHVKLYFPRHRGDRPLMPRYDPDGKRLTDAQPISPRRDLTVRRYSTTDRELDIDIFLHGAGIASEWVAAAEPGHYLGVAGPRGSVLIPDEFDWHFLAGDETALPAVARRLEELGPDTRALALLEVDDVDEQQPLTSAADVEVVWAYREGASGDIAPLQSALDELIFPAGDYFAWAAGEAGMVRKIREHLLDERAANADWLRTRGYWKHGVAAFAE